MVCDCYWLPPKKKMLLSLVNTCEYSINGLHSNKGFDEAGEVEKMLTCN